MVIAVNNGNREFYLASLVVRQGDVAILGSCLLAVNRVFSLIVTHSTGNGHLNLCVGTNVECSSACGIEGDHDSVSSVEGVFSGLGGDAILIGTFVSIAVINVNRQGHVTSLVAGNVDAILGVGRFGLAFKVSRVGDQHIVADGAGRSNFHIHYITHGVGFSHGISSQRDADSFTCGDVEGDGLSSLSSVIVEVLDGNREDDLASFVARNRHVALLVGFQSGLANHVGHVIFANGVLHLSNLHLDFITNSIVRLGGVHREGDSGSGIELVSTTLLYSLSIRTAVKGGNCQGYSNSLVVGQGYIALGVGSQRLCLDLLINGVASYVFNFAFANSVLNSDFYLSLGANVELSGCGIQRNCQRLVVNGVSTGCGGCASVLVTAVINHHSQVDGASLVGGQHDTGLSIVVLCFTFLTELIGDGRVGSDIALNSYSDILHVTHGVGAGGRSQRDVKFLSGIKYVGLGIGSLLVAIDGGNGEYYVASLLVGKGDVAIFTDSQGLLANLVGEHGVIAAVLNSSLHLNLLTHLVILSRNLRQSYSQRLVLRRGSLLNIDPAVVRGGITGCVVAKAVVTR